MSEKYKTAFFAYPAEPHSLRAAIDTSIEEAKISLTSIGITAWPQMEVFGQIIPDTVRGNIDEVDVLICDITKPNMNVYYEAGFAIGRGKTIAPVINISFENAAYDIQKDGIFDNIGYKTYENSQQLIDIFKSITSSNLIELYSKPINFQQPLYVLDSYRKTNFRNAIITAIKDSKVFYRSFDPVEIPRFSAVPTISNVTSSAGIVIPILGNDIYDALRHNLRASFLCGLSHGLNRKTLILKEYFSDGDSDAADYRDFVVSVKDKDDINETVINFARDAHLAAQSINQSSNSYNQKSQLQLLTLGATAAENEFRTLQEYFVETAEFIKAVRGEGHIVTGRKGSGKSAIFFRVRDIFREKKDTVVTDLKPESHQLSLFREELLKVIDKGAFDHTLSAFWYFLVLSEILLTIKKVHDHKSKFDGASVFIANEIEKLLTQFKIFDAGDFTSRINQLGSLIVKEIKSYEERDQSVSWEHLTNIIFKGGISQIKESIIKYTSNKTTIVFLFDNIDKGWPANGLHEFDIRLVRILTETLERVRRDFNTQNREFMSIVFLRNDIYELLVNDTSDRGKSAQIKIDWTDKAKLRQVIYKRLQVSSKSTNKNFEEVWTKFFNPKTEQEDSFEYFLEHCLMRPRFLINIIENAISNAINRGHIKVEQQDCLDAVRQHSLYLISDFGYEIRDVSGITADILYAFIGVTKLLTKDEVFQYFNNFGLNETEFNRILRLFLWYGVLGIGNTKGDECFIYNYDYDMKRLEAEIRSMKDEVLYIVNPAFHVALTT